MTRLAAIACCLAGCGVADTGLLLCPPGTTSTVDGCQKIGGGPDGGTGFVTITDPRPFGRAPVGGLYRREFSVRNDFDGTLTIRLDRVDGSDAFEIAMLPIGSSFDLAPGEGKTLEVLYRPQGGNEGATFVFYGCDNELCRISMRVSGFGVEQAFRCGDGELGSTAVGECSEHEIRCTNDTDYRVTLDAVNVIGSRAFAASLATPGDVFSHAMILVVATFCPQDVGFDRAELELRAKVPEGENDTRYPITGEGISTTGVLRCEPNSVMLGPLQIGTAETQLVDCFVNGPTTLTELRVEPGMSPLTVRALVDGGIPAFPFFVTPMDSIQLEITFVPAMPGDYRDTIHFDYEGGSERIEVRASAFDQTGCQLSFQPTFDFGTQLVGQTQLGTTPIVNIGFGSCTIFSLGLTAMSDPELMLVGPLPMTMTAVPPGMAVQVDLQFTPTQARAYSGTFSFTVPELGIQQQIDIVGRGAVQSNGYTVMTLPNTTLIPAGGAPIAFNNPDDDFEQVPIGFPFEFDGMPVTTAYVSTNGMIGFESANGVQSFVNNAIPVVASPNGFIAWWWDDLQTNNPGGPPSTVTTTIAGVAPNRAHIFTFLDVTGFGNQLPIINAEVRLFEGSNLIEVHYGPITPRMNDFSASAGWEGFGGTSGADVFNCSPNCTSASWPANTLLQYLP